MQRQTKIAIAAGCVLPDPQPAVEPTTRPVSLLPPRPARSCCPAPIHAGTWQELARFLLRQRVLGEWRAEAT
ncbi:MAG: hypothetical protein ACE1Y4_08440, partial [Lysobacterales bacterium]